MKKIIFFSMAVALFACNSGTDKKEAAAAKNTDLIQQNLKGKVQQIDESTVNIDSMGVSKPDSLTAVSMFDEKGYQTSYFTKDSSGKKITEQTVKHNADGSFSEVKSMKNGKQTYRLVTDYKDGQYTGGKNYDSTDKQDSYYTDLKTNEYGIVYAGVQHKMDSSVKASFEMKYDGANFVGGTSKDSTGKVTYTGTVKLDDKGDASEETATTTEKGVTKTEKMTYKYVRDDKGNWTERTTMNEKGKATKIVKRTITYYKD